MAINNLYSKRQKKQRGEVPDVYSYSVIPEALRIQVIHICNDVIGDAGICLSRRYGTYDAYEFIASSLRREYGVFILPGNDPDDDNSVYVEFVNFLLREESTDRVLDAVELAFRIIDTRTRHPSFLNRPDSDAAATLAIDELNQRFQEHGIGYQWIDGEIIRIDSQLLHSHVTKPALVLLHSQEYGGAQAEFLKAHEHYRHGNTKEALTECLKALESVLKTICDKRNWSYSTTATCKNLIDICFEKELVPAFWQSHFSALRSTLETGVPTARNRLGGHGQGSSVVIVPKHLVSYVLHMTAACLVFLIESEQSLP